MRKQYSLSRVITIVLIAVSITFSLTMMISTRIFDNTVRSVKEKEAMYTKLSELDQIIRMNYYGDIDEAYLMDMIGTGYVTGINSSNSRYYTARQFSELQASQNGEHVGIGVEVIKDATSGYVKIITVYSGSPAEEMAVTTDHYIVRINETDVRNLSIESVRTLLQGETGTVVQVAVMVDGQESNIDIVRRAYEAPTVTFTLVDGIGYIKISTFNTKTVAELDFAVRSLVGQGAQGFVIDVRNNTSTQIDQAARAADLLCPEGTIVSAVYRDGREEILFTSDTSCTELPIVVVVNRTTSTAAEVFTLALRDMNNARVVGERTVGRGTYQKIFRLTDGSALELTVALLKPNTSESFNRSGISPDYESSLRTDQEAIYYSIPIEQDPQIQRSFEVLNALIRNTTVAPSTTASSAPESEDSVTEDSEGESSAEEDSSSEEE